MSKVYLLYRGRGQFSRERFFERSKSWIRQLLPPRCISHPRERKRLNLPFSARKARHILGVRGEGGGGKKKESFCSFFYKNCNSYTIAALQPHTLPKVPINHGARLGDAVPTGNRSAAATAAATAQGQMLIGTVYSALKAITELAEPSPSVSSAQRLTYSVPERRPGTRMKWDPLKLKNTQKRDPAEPPSAASTAAAPSSTQL